MKECELDQLKAKTSRPFSSRKHKNTKNDILLNDEKEEEEEENDEEDDKHIKT
jgi:hypothetical protein